MAIGDDDSGVANLPRTSDGVPIVNIGPPPTQVASNNVPVAGNQTASDAEPDWSAPVSQMSQPPASSSGVANLPRTPDGTPIVNIPAPSQKGSSPPPQIAEPDWSAPMSADPSNTPQKDAPDSTATSLATNVGAGANDAIASTLGAPVDFANYSLGRLPGVGPYLHSDMPIGGSESIKRVMGLIGANPDNTPANTTGEKIARGVGAGVASLVVPQAAFGAASEAGMLAPKAASLLEKAVGSSAGAGDLAANSIIGGVSGGTGTAAEQVVPDPIKPLVGAVAGLAGGVATGVGLNRLGYLPASESAARIAARPPAPPAPDPMGDVDLSAGQALPPDDPNRLPLIQREQAGNRNLLGQEALDRTTAFNTQQQNQLGTRSTNISRALSPAGEQVVQSPQEAAQAVAAPLQEAEAQKQAQIATQATSLNGPRLQAPSHLDMADQVADSLRSSAANSDQAQARTAQNLAGEREGIRSSLAPAGQPAITSPLDAATRISNSVQDAEEAQQTAVNAAYKDYRDMDGQYTPEAWDGVGNRVRKTLNTAEAPVILDGNTPQANAMVQYLDSTLGANAEEALDPEAKSFSPFTPSSVYAVRKRLSAMSQNAQRSAMGSNNYNDAWAARNVLKAFDQINIDNLHDPEAFSGDGEAVADALQNAMAMHSDLRATFSPQGPGDKVGPIMQQIVGRHEGQEAPPNQIQSWMYGNGPTPVLVARKLIKTFGANSPEVGAAKQGFLSNAVDQPRGMTPYTPSEMADNITDAISGKGRALAETYLSADERQALLNHADNLRQSAAPKVLPADSVAKTIQQVVGSGGQPTGTNDFAAKLWGNNPDKVGSSAVGVNIAQHILNTEPQGRDSAAFQALRQGTVSKLLDSASGRVGFDPAAISARIREFLNNSGRNMANTLFSPGEKVSLSNYADALDQHAALVGAKPSNDAETVLSKIAGANGQPQATPTEISDWLYSRSGLADRGVSTRVAQQLKSQFGEKSPQWAGVKQGLWSKLTEKDAGAFNPKQTADRIDTFLGSSLSDAMLSPAEKKMFQGYADLNRKLIVPQSGANWSNTSGPVVKELSNLAHTIAAGAGLMIAKWLGFGPVGEIAGAYAGNKALGVVERFKQAAQASKLSDQMPLVSEKMARFQAAVKAADRASTSPAARAAASSAAIALTRAMTPLGI